MGVGKVDKKLFHAKYGNDPVAYFEHLPNVKSVKVCQDEIEVTFLEEIMYGRCTENSIGRSVRIPFK